jgi:hypothetical protein
MNWRVTGEQVRGLLREQLAELPDGGVGLLGDEHLRLAALRVDHEQRWGVRDHPALDRRLDRVGLSHPFQLR